VLSAGNGQTLHVDFVPTDTADYTNASKDVAINVTQAALTVSGITANNKTYDGGTTAVLSGTPGTLVAVIGTDDVTLTGTAVGAFADKNVGTVKTVTVSGQSLGGAQAGNYNLTEPLAAADITAQALTVSATGQNKVYDGTAAATVTLSDNRVVGDTLSTNYVSAAFADPNVGTGKTVFVSGISISGIDAGNYTFNTTAVTTADILAPAVAVSFALASSSASETVAEPAIVVSLSPASALAVTVDYAVDPNSTAVSGTNYTLPPGTLNFAAGDTTKTIPLAILHDGVCTADLTVLIVLANPVNAALGPTLLHTYTVVDSDFAITARETQDSDGNGRIDAIRIVTSGPLNDDFIGLDITVAGYTVRGYSTGRTANDSEFFILLNEGPLPDTAARPGVELIAGGSLTRLGGQLPLPAEAAPSTPADKAKPVLLSASWFDASGAGVDAADPLYLTFSEPVTSNGALAKDFGLPVAYDTFGADATVANSQNQQDTSMLTITLLGAQPGEPKLTSAGVYSPGALTAGSPTGIYVVDGTRLVDQAGNPALVQTVETAVDLGPSEENVSLAWVAPDGSVMTIDSRQWDIGASSVGAAHYAFDAFQPNGLVVRNNGNVWERIAVSCSDASPDGQPPYVWNVASLAGQDRFEMKVDNTGHGDYTLDLATGPKEIATQLYSGHNQAFDLQFKLPTTLSAGAGVNQRISVTITATRD